MESKFASDVRWSMVGCGGFCGAMVVVEEDGEKGNEV